ncbi:MULTISPECIES: V-type ATP synthase subunit E [Thermococcus]|uniref:A-type ATP synthase subunit E n=1 Tax=Thermococcus sibiricus (strain DSM 12597 / MM 739) TaxID=604354 RepID=AATE_THESM|nr:MULTISPECIES: V-type ATP synthase subunit E [Thermococcus]C6A5F1.1 RecName: Full=V-type proton ATPase subunit E; AltName: Full=V-ATPase subunit E [Thermococcus sibiricus MM 739]ACS90846.1 A1A0 ATP synthase, subunit E [Thermococcus sibiricus MM 739]MBC7094134.1 V-type ATP synthase subunit E [Thermococcus sp.]HII66885.1 V-type ATP synthase subunit E [Thermococcaceae archaeon]
MEGARLIIEEINKEAEQKIKYILEEAEQKAEKIKQEAEKKARIKADWIIRKAQTQAELEKQRIIANAKLEVRRKKLVLQEELINEVIGAIKDRLLSIPEAEYMEILKDLIVTGIRELGEEKVVLSSNGETLSLLKAHLKEMEESVNEKLGKDITISLGEPIETIGGVIVQNLEKTIRIDNTFEARMERLQADLRTKIAKILFG